jgi:hypothetical protein
MKEPRTIEEFAAALRGRDEAHELAIATLRVEANLNRERITALEAALKWALDALGDPPDFTGKFKDWDAARAALAGRKT